MQLQKHIRPGIDPKNPWENDHLKRKDTATYLTPIIASTRQPIVISISASFGMGKTDFVMRWKADLDNQGFKTAYFNAWESDFSANPLAAFISSLKRGLAGGVGASRKAAITKKINKLTQKASGMLRGEIIPILTRAIVRKALGSDTLNEIKELGLDSEELEGIAEEVSKAALAAQEAAEFSMEAFKTELKNIVESETRAIQDTDKKKLIVFVDELDRCRPSYAVEVLETIKHLFSVENVVFIISIDEDQLRKTVSTIYGADMDGPGYFARFFDWQIMLPEPDNKGLADYLCEQYEFGALPCFSNQNLIVDQYDFYDLDAMCSWFTATANALELSPRQRSRCFVELNLVLKSLNPEENPLCAPLGFVAAFKNQFPSESRQWFYKIQNTSEDTKKLKELIGNIRLNEDQTHLEFNDSLKVWSYLAKDLRKLENEIDNMDSRLWSGSSDGADRARLREKIAYYSLYKNFHINNRTASGMSIFGICYSRLEKASTLIQ